MSDIWEDEESQDSVEAGDCADLDAFEMIRTLDIKNYRAFGHLKLSGLGRVNLLVGKNNSGKTSILEALNLLGTNASPYTLWHILTRRGERVVLEGSSTQPVSTEIYVRYLFHGLQGNDLPPETAFSIKATTDGKPQSLTCRVAELQPRDAQGNVTARDPDKPISYGLTLETPTKPARTSFVSLTRRGTVTMSAIDTGARRVSTSVIADATTSTQFVSTESLGFEELQTMFNAIALTDAEDRVIRAMKFIDSSIDGIRTSASPSRLTAGRAGFKVRQAGRDPVPIGTLGDGIWRILALAMALSQAKDGMLLVDEIDTGLHHSVMKDMWKFIDETAKLLNVQVFATTHSADCVQSLASICNKPEGNDSITIQRVESGKVEAIRYSEDEIRQAATNRIEVR